MEEALRQVGLSDKEAVVYLALLEKSNQTAAELALATGEKRTNVYMLLESLLAKQLVVANDGQPIRAFSPADPHMLGRLLQARQERHQQAVIALKAAMPQLKMRYGLTNNRPGVTHAGGIEGYTLLLDDMVNSSTEVLLVVSNDVPPNSEVLDELRKRLLKRKDAGVTTRALVHQDESSPRRAKEFAERGIDLRFLGEKPFQADVVVYEDNVAFTVYKPTLVVTIITNDAMADTMRTLFEELWAKSGAL